MVFYALLRADREKDAELWLTKLQDLVTKDMDTAAEKDAEKKKQKYSDSFVSFYDEFIDTARTWDIGGKR